MTDIPRTSTTVHLIGGCVSGSVAAVATCPLEVVKTRLQVRRDLWVSAPAASYPSFSRPSLPSCCSSAACVVQQASTEVRHSRLRHHVSLTTGISSASMVHGEIWKPPSGLFSFARYIVSTEGPLALFKGLGPTMAGLAPTKALYFATYSSGKKFFGRSFGSTSSTGHFCAAATAGSVVATVMSPVWVLKTRIQLDQRRRGGETPSLLQRVVQMYRTEGIRCFYRGLSASYFGVSETAVYFVLYEKSKLMILDYNMPLGPGHVVAVSAMAKLLACIPFYPHEVARTRMRQAAGLNGERRYSRFLPTLRTVFMEEGVRGLYGGLGPHLMRVIPNTVILFSCYEYIVKNLS